MAIRTTTAQIDDAILDAAAALFARQGFERTSVQQVADVVGYSKTGLLHRFASKAAILTAVEGLIEDKITALRIELEAIEDLRERTLVALHTMTTLALAHPGAVEYELATLHEAERLDGSCLTAHPAERLLSVILGPDPSPERSVRLMLALQLICSGAVISATKPIGDLGGSLPQLLVDLAGTVVGNLEAAPAPLATFTAGPR